MANEQFDLGEALGSYEQAQADRDFYLSMVQGGTQMASPIAAYLAGVSGVKMATMRQKAQAIQDERQADKDAIAATEKAQNYGLKIQQNLFDIAKAANQGEISKSTAAAMYGYLIKEAGGTPISYDADNGILTYQIRGDEYEADLSKYGMSKKDIEAAKDVRQQRSQEAIAARQERGSELRMKEAGYKASLKSGGTGQEKYTTLSAFNSTHKDVISALGRKARMDRLTFGQIKDFVEGVESLSPKDKEQMEAKVDDILEYVRTAPRAQGWSFSTKGEQQKSLNELWGE